MGYYINPRNLSKEQWLVDNGRPPQLEPKAEFIQPDEHWVCLVDNGQFTAAGIAFNQGEFNAFNYPDDYRPKVWFAVSDEKLIEEVPSVAHALEPYSGNTAQPRDQFD